MDNIVVGDKTTSEISAKAWGNLQLSGPSVVEMPVAPSQVASVSQSGNDLIVTLKTGEKVTVSNFFTTNPDALPSDIVFRGDDGVLWQAQYSSKAFTGFTFDEISSLDSLLPGAGIVSTATSEWAIAGLGLLGAGGAAAASGGGGGGGGGSSSSGDVTAPTAPNNLILSADGLTLRGNGEVGATVSVRGASGNLLGTAVVGSDGTFSVPLSAPQNNGSPLTVGQTDAAGNTSAPATVTTPDTTAPSEPGNLAVGTNGLNLTGTGEAGATVTVRDAAGNVLGTAIVGSDGHFSVALNSAQLNGQVLSVGQTDAAGNASAQAHLAAADTTAPAAPSGLVFNADGSQLHGAAEAGATVQVRSANGALLGSAVAAADGTFNLTLSPAQGSGQVVSVSATDNAGNASTASSVMAPDVSLPPADVTPPAAPTQVTLNGTGTQLSGHGEVGATVNIVDASGTLLGTGIVGADGTFNVTLTPSQIGGQALSVTLTDAAGNVSDNVAVTAPDLTQPAPPENLMISSDGLTLTGTAQHGLHIVIRSVRGVVLGSGDVAADGTFSIHLSTPQTNGELLDITAVDANGNSTVPIVMSAPDSTPPAAVSDLQVSPDGATLAGKGEVGDTVTVRDVNGAVLATGTVATNGTFIISLSPAVVQGATLTVSQTDGGHNTSPDATVTVPDASGPVAPDHVALNTNGTVVTGNGTAGNTVEVRDADGHVLGSAVVGLDGTFSVPLTPAQVSGQLLDVVAVAPGGAESVPVSLQTSDLTAPDQPTDAAVNPNGLLVTGHGEPGATVTIRDAHGDVIATGQVTTSGTFAVALPTSQTEGQALQVTLTDAAGNTSQAVDITAPDTTVPDPLTNVRISADGALVTGNGEVGDRVTVVDANGTVLGSAVVAANGLFEISLAPAQTNGQLLSISQADATHTSAPQALPAPDITAPDAPVILVLDANGRIISGTGEIGATVTVHNAAGVALGSAVVNNDGTFSITLQSVQLNGQHLDISQTDVAGNQSVVVDFNAIDSTAPLAVTGLQISSNGATLVGLGEAGSTVTVVNASNAVLGTAVVGTDGTFSVSLNPAQLNGQQLSVSQADISHNVSLGVSLTAPDFTAPLAPTNLHVNALGTVLSGQAEAGALVEVKDANGHLLGSTNADSNGAFSIGLSSPQLNGESLSLVVTDAQGNASQPWAYTVADSVPPPAVQHLVLSANGDTISGTGEAGTTVTVTRGDGTVLGTGAIGSNGVFVVNLTTPAAVTDTLTVVSTDASGLSSPDATLSGSDVSVVTTPTALALSGDGFTLTGVGTAGNTITVVGSGGTTLGTANVGSNGTFTVVLQSAQLNGQTLNVTAADGSGHTSIPGSLTVADVTAPDAPTNLLVSTDGSALSGRGEVGARVTVTDANGHVLGTATVAGNGTFSVSLDPSQINAQSLIVKQADLAGNLSQPGTTFAPDLQSPDAPTGLSINAVGTVVSGQGEAGTTVSVRDANGNLLAQGLVDQSGNFQVTLPIAQLTGAPLQVQLTDAANNVSAAASLATLDRTPPAAVAALTINADGSTVGGHGEAGATVSVRDASGAVLGSALVGVNGSFSVTLSPAANNGQTLEITQADASGNVSPQVTLPAPDITPPAALTDVVVSANGQTLSGHGEPGATVSVHGADGTLIGTALVGVSGTFTVTLTSVQNNAQVLTVNQEDPPGNVGTSIMVNAPDLVAPVSPNDLSLNAAGLQLSGHGEAGSTVTASDTQGNVLGTALVAANGTFLLTLNAAQLNGQVLSIKANDAAGNISPAVAYTAADVTAPVAVTNLAVSGDGATLTGLGEPSASVSVSNAGGTVLGTGTVASNGTFSLTLTPVAAGTALTVVQSDAAHNASPPVSVVAPGNLAPSPPSDLLLSTDGLTLTGLATAGTIVSVHGLGGVLLGNGFAAADGTFSITLVAAQTNGETLSVKATSTEGLDSLPTQLLANDTTPPAALVDYHLGANGITLTGHGEVGATVTVLGQGGVILGSALVAADGTFSATLSTAQLAGQVLSLSQSDAAGNESPAVNVTAPDLLAPLAPSNVIISNDGTHLTGTGEAGTTVTVTNAAGTNLGTAVVRVDGSFEVDFTTAGPQANGQILSVTLTDAAGNVSPATNPTPVDTTAPVALVDAVIAGDGATINGRGEAGATVTVLDANNHTIGTALVGVNGAFTLVLAIPLINAQVITLSQADAAGNISPSVSLNAPDLTAPTPLADVHINAAGIVVTGTGEAGASVTVRDSSGVLLGSSLVLANGSFSVTLIPPQINLQQLSVQQADPPGNISTAIVITAPDLTPPNAPADLQINLAGSQLSGTGEAGAHVTITLANGTLVGSGDVGTDGHFLINLTQPQTNGQTLQVVLTDASLNASAVGILPAPDTTPPAAVVINPMIAPGAIISGTGEIGAHLLVTNAAGDVIGNGTVAGDGTFSIQLTAAQNNGQVLTVIQQDATGNPSLPTTVNAPDITAPASPVPLTLSADGLTLSGTGEVGATVKVFSSMQVSLGTATVDSTGHFSVQMNAAQLNGQLLNVSQSDLAGNGSGTAIYLAADVTPPALATGLALSTNGLLVSGNGEIGASVTVLSGTTVLGTGTVAADGSFSVNLDTAQLNGGQLGVVLADASLNASLPELLPVPDVTAPAAPLVTTVIASSVTGTAEANSFVTVRDAGGNSLGTIQADANGNYVIALTTPQANGQPLTITAVDAAGNTSSALHFPAIDTTAPGLVTLLSISTDYRQLAGHGEPGATVTVTLGATSLGSAVVGADGLFVVTLVPAVTGNAALSIVQTDVAHNPSGSASFTAPLTPPPTAPVAVLSTNGLTVTGTAVANSSVTVYDKNHVSLGTAAADGSGAYSVTLSAAQTNGQTLQVTASTTLGGESVPTTVIAGDTTPPAALLNPAINGSGTIVTGTGEAGATVTIKTALGAALGTAVVDANGTFSVTLSTPQANGQILSALQTDNAGNPSTAVSINAPDITPPTVATGIALTTNGLVLSGTGEIGATVKVFDAQGNSIGVGTVTVGPSGTFSISLNAAQLNGQSVTVTLTDAAGNISVPAPFSALDVTAPNAPAGLLLSSNGLQLTGTGEPGATVTVTDSAGNSLGQALVSANGNFSVQLSTAQLNGQALTLHQADLAGNLSAGSGLTAADITAPVVASNLAVATDGTALSGRGEIGTTASVFTAGGVLLGSAVVGSDGTFSVPLSPLQADGQTLTVRLTDGAHNVSSDASVIAGDITAPVAPTTGLVNASGTSVSGTGIAGDLIVVRSSDGFGTLLGQATVNANGTYSVTLNAAQINNQILNITQLDAAGNVSVALPAVAPDLTPPVAASTLLVSGDGLTLTGHAEAGAIVTVKSVSGAILGTGQAAGDGTFSIVLTSAQINGEVLTVSLADAKGNVSLPTNVTAPDIDAGLPVVASDNLATAQVTLTPVTTSSDITGTFNTLIGLGGLNKAFTFSVASGTTAHSSLTLTTASILQLSTAATYTLQVKDASGNWVTLGVASNGGTINLGVLSGTALKVDMGTLLAGDYRLVAASNTLTVLSTVSSDLHLDVTSLTQFNGAGAAVSGNVITDPGTDGTVDITGPDHSAVLQVLKGGGYVNAGAGTTVQGLYGTLTIDSTGHYTYTPNGAISSVGKVDVFSYQLVAPNGLSDTANLYVRIDSPQSTEAWSNDNLAAPALLVDATNDIASTDLTLSNLVTSSTSSLFTASSLLGGISGQNTFSVAANTVSDLTLTITGGSLLSLLGGLNLVLYKLNTTTGNYDLVKTVGGASLLSLGGGSYGVNVDDQTAGTYRVNLTVTGVGLLTSLTVGLINTATFSNQFVVSSNTAVSGNLFTDTAGGGADVLGSAFTTLSVLAAGIYVAPGYNGTSIVGTYGTLLVHADGSYNYTLKAGLTDAAVGHEDVFSYQLTHPGGTTDIATLTIDLHQATVSAFASVAAVSIVDDAAASTLHLTQTTVSGHEVLQGSAGNDTLDGSHGGAVTLNGGAGNDTLIIADQHFTSVDGGTGTDTLLWAGGDASIDLGNLQARIHNIEIIDLNATSAVKLTLGLADLVAITEADNSTLLIKGNQQDSVHMTGEWTADGTHLASGLEYVQYTPQEDPTHHLWVQNGIQVV